MKSGGLVIKGVQRTRLRSGPGAQAKEGGGGSRSKGQQQRESNPQSRAVRCGAFCRRARWPAQTSSRPTSWRPSGSTPPPGTAALGKHAWGAPAEGWEKKRGVGSRGGDTETGRVIVKARNTEGKSKHTHFNNWRYVMEENTLGCRLLWGKKHHHRNMHQIPGVYFFTIFF